MNILYYTWNENSANDMADALIYMGHRVVKCQIPFTDYDNDENFTQNLERIFWEQGCEIFLSFDFFPLIAKSADKLKRKYISWVYDTPHRTLYSPRVRSAYVYLFLFDRVQYLEMLKLKGTNVFHMPLAVNAGRLNKQLGIPDKNIIYQQDVSFIGSLYENNMFQKIHYMPEYLKGYIEGLIQAQKKVYGYNLIEDALEEDILSVFRKAVPLNLDKSYLWKEKQIYSDMINEEITHQERKELLKIVSEIFNFKLFTASKAEDFPKKVLGGILSYNKEMPEMFRETRINLNITLRSITSGIPLRALDIMGAGGFLLSNYQPELAEFFVNGEEMVMFEGTEDMIEKIAYYLTHEEERMRIAYNGWKKVQEEYSYDRILQEIFKRSIAGGVE